MAGIITVDNGRYLGAHTCPAGPRERAIRANFAALQERNGEVPIEIIPARETCLEYATRMNAQALRVAFTRSHPAAKLLADAIGHLSEEDTATFRATVEKWEPAW